MDALEGSGKRITSTPKTSCAGKRVKYDSPTIEYTDVVPITPMPDYNGMDTPEAQRHAQKYGLKKRLGKMKLRTKLKEVYLYTHQTCSIQEKSPKGETQRRVDQKFEDKPLDQSNDLIILDMSNDQSLDLVKNGEENENSSFQSLLTTNVQGNRGSSVVNVVPNPSPLLRNEHERDGAPGINLSNEIISLLDSSSEDYMPLLAKAGGDDPPITQRKSFPFSIRPSNPPDEVRLADDSYADESTFPADSTREKIVDECVEVDFVKEVDHHLHFLPSQSTDEHFYLDENREINEQSAAEVISLLDVSEDVEGIVSTGHSEDNGAVTSLDASVPVNDALFSSPEKGTDHHLFGEVGSANNSDAPSAEEDTQEEPGSDHEELHRSLFVSTHRQDASSSESSSSNEEQEECKSLMQRLLEKRKGNSTPNACKREVPHASTDASLSASEFWDAEQAKNENAANGRKHVDFFNNNAKGDNNANRKTEEKRIKVKKIKLSADERKLAMHNAICSDDEIYALVLQYKPVYLSRFKILMDENNIKVCAADLLDFLDNQGITFSTADENKGPRLKKRKPKK